MAHHGLFHGLGLCNDYVSLPVKELELELFCFSQDAAAESGSAIDASCVFFGGHRMEDSPSTFKL